MDGETTYLFARCLLIAVKSRMLSLPLDYPEPFAATLGIMLYPGTDNDDPSKALAFAAQWLATPLHRYHGARRRLPYEALARIAEGSGASLTDLDERFWGGTATGELVKALLALAISDPRLASWSNAVRVFIIAKDRSAKGSRTDLLKAKQRFSSVAHLWGAWSIREGRFEPRPDVGYDCYDDFQSFLAEAESIRRWGQTWQPPRTNSSPVFSCRYVQAARDLE
jgi:hypothetical protein